MARLPIPGQDPGEWGDILNEYLLVSHDQQGYLSQDTVDTTSLAAPIGTDGQALVLDSAAAGGFKWATLSTGTPVSPATTTTQGTVQLSGDLAGTATAPTVPELANKADKSTTYTKTEVDTALSTKQNTITAGTVSQYYRGDKTWQTLDKTAVGLSNVDNTTDLGKPISTATQTALNSKLTGVNTATITVGATAPASPAVGDLWVDTN